jgi:hypothetical protein
MSNADDDRGHNPSYAIPLAVDPAWLFRSPDGLENPKHFLD